MPADKSFGVVTSGSHPHFKEVAQACHLVQMNLRISHKIDLSQLLDHAYDWKNLPQDFLYANFLRQTYPGTDTHQWLTPIGTMKKKDPLIFGVPLADFQPHSGNFKIGVGLPIFASEPGPQLFQYRLHELLILKPRLKFIVVNVHEFPGILRLPQERT